MLKAEVRVIVAAALFVPVLFGRRPSASDRGGLRAVPLVQTNPIAWRTAHAKLAASYFHIKLGDTYFYGVPEVTLGRTRGSTAPHSKWRGVSTTSRWGSRCPSSRSGRMWRLVGLRTRNQEGSDWIDYSPVSVEGISPAAAVGQPSLGARMTFKGSKGNAEIRCDACSITAFIEEPLVTSRSGFAIAFRIGLPPGEPITIPAKANTGYGVNAILMSGDPPAVVRDQSDLDYSWSAEDGDVVSLAPMSVQQPDGTCAHGILPPCPSNNVQIKGISAGVTRVILEVKRRSTGEVVASGSFDVKVVNAKSDRLQIQADTRERWVAHLR